MKSVIYTQRVEVVESYKERRDCTDQRIADFLVSCGYLPVPLANVAGIAEEYLRKLNPVGILLTGGNSLCQYGGNAPERDAMDEKLLHLAETKMIPVLGICRGMQSIVNHFGGVLEDVTGHVAVKHTLQGSMGGRIVNSFHNQACKEVGTETRLQVLASTEDNVIEAVKHKDFPIVGIMWHPEREETYCAEDIELLKGLFGG